VDASVSIVQVQDGRLVVDGIDLVDLAGRIPTPFYVYSARRLRWNVESLRNAFTRRHIDTDVFYASKACSMMWFLRQVLASGIDIEVNSGGELWKALKAGFRPDQVIFNGVAKTEAEIRESLRVGIRAFVVDSLSELERIGMQAGALQCPAPLALRVDVDVPTLAHAGMATTHGGKMGTDLDQALEGYRFAAAHQWIRPRGLHMHLGSQITTPEPYARGMETALDLAERIEAECDLELEFLDVGGGFPVPFKPAEGPVDPGDYFRTAYSIEDYAETVCALLEKRRPDLRLFVEPGRAIAASAAVLVTRVEAEKVKFIRDARGSHLGEERWLVIDAGYNTLLEHCLYRWYYPCVVANRLDEPPTASFRLAGPLCDAGDVFVGDGGTCHGGGRGTDAAGDMGGDPGEADCRRFPASTTVGDVLVFSQVGAYGLEMMQPTLCRPRAAVYGIEDGIVRLVQREETYEDMIARDEGWQPRRSGSGV
jgi:diaminopimelate decarboxylase